MVEIRQIAHYEILRKLGEGGMGEVFQARDMQLGRLVALKILPERVASDSRRLRRFLQEARIASRLSHPGITHLYEVREEGGVHYLAMEYVEGKTLETRLKNGPLPAAEAVRYAIQVAAALEEAHGKGIVHRDIKPANLMITGSGEIKVLDFGLARALAEDPTDPETKTETGVVLGTVQYMSPEQALGEKVDARSDLFSLGIVMYEMVSGRRPFSGAGFKGVLNQIVTAAPGPLQLPDGEAYAELRRILNKCLRKERDERYQSARDLAADLSHVLRLLSSGEILEGGGQPAEFRLPRRTARALFLVLQVVYLVMYVASLRWPSGMEAGLTGMFGNTWGGEIFRVLLVSALLGIAVRLYLIGAVALDHVGTGVQFRKAFPFFFLLDEIWCLAPFGLAPKIGELLALACVPPLAFSAFSQRTLISAAYELRSPARRSN